MYLIFLMQIFFFVIVAKVDEYIDLENVDYCQLCKIKGSHTVCRYPQAGGRWPCALSPLSEEEKLRLLRAHNALRSRVARGLQPAQPPAADMRRLRWDLELEAVAARWAEQCVDDHDACRASARFPVGQNLAWRSRWDLERLVDLWFLEVELFNATGGVRAYAFNPSTGHYTQLVWAQTRLLGCARADRGPERPLRFALVCNYGPAGNVVRRPVYHVGPPRSACPRGTGPDQEYLGLCASPDADFPPMRLHPNLAPRSAHARTDPPPLHRSTATAAPTGGDPPSSAHRRDSKAHATRGSPWHGSPAGKSPLRAVPHLATREQQLQAGEMRSWMSFQRSQWKPPDQLLDTTAEEQMDTWDNRTMISKSTHRRLEKTVLLRHRKRSSQRTGVSTDKYDVSTNSGAGIAKKLQAYDIRLLIVFVLRMLSA